MAQLFKPPENYRKKFALPNVIAAEALNIRSILVDGDGAKTVADLDAVLGLN